MEKISITNIDDKHLTNLYEHLSVQSMLDIKAVNGEVSMYVLDRLKEQSSICKSVSYNGKTAYVVFVIPTDNNEFSIFVLSSTLGYSDNESLKESFSSIIRGLPKANFYSIVYKGNHKYAKLLKDNGFRFIKNIIHGKENRNFLLLGKKADE